MQHEAHEGHEGIQYFVLFVPFVLSEILLKEQDFSSRVVRK